MSSKYQKLANERNLKNYKTVFYYTKRKCLNCNKIFNSSSYGNRICEFCKRKEDFNNPLMSY